jgi:hypothetical protein
VGTLLTVIAVIVFPTVLGYAVIGSLKLSRQLSENRRQPDSMVEPIERLGADLRRLHAKLDAMENRPGLAEKGLKLRAVRAAYVDALATACHQLDVNPPHAGNIDQVPLTEIYRVEAALRQRGMDVRRPVTR